MKCWMLFVFLVHRFSAILCTEMSTTFVSRQTFDDFISIETFISEKTFSSSIQCAMECQFIVNCKSFFYNKNSSTCKLVSKVIGNTTNTTISRGMRYYVHKIETMTKCSKQLTVYGSNITLNEEQVPGSVVAYTCADGYESSNGGGTVTCGVTGLWSPPTDLCRRCGNYSSSYLIRRGKNFYPPQHMLGGWYASLSNVGDETYCTDSCTNRMDFTCLATYYNAAAKTCLDIPVRVEENLTKYGPYYFDDPSYDEYIRLCV